MILRSSLRYDLEGPNRIFRYKNRGFDHGYDLGVVNTTRLGLVKSSFKVFGSNPFM